MERRKETGVKSNCWRREGVRLPETVVRRGEGGRELIKRL